MIDPAEIENKAKLFEITTSNVQRDYLFGWLIHGLFTSNDLKDVLFLKGGNALRKGYFENTRFSKDLDLGIPNDINKDKLLLNINEVCNYIQQKANISFNIQNNQIKEKFTGANTPIPDLKVYEIRIYFKDFYGKDSQMNLKVTLDLTRFDKTLSPIQTVNLIHPYSDASEIACTFRCMKLEEIIATKLKCLLQRQHTPDLFDYVYSINLLGGSINKEEVVRLLLKKTIFERNPNVLKEILKGISQSYFREYWNKTIICAKQTMIDAEYAINTFISDLDSLFSIFQDNGFRNFIYFEAPYRIPIMEAGRSQTLLKIRYKGDERLVEPYSLKYQQKRDGSEREYLYVYNVSGGSNPPGMRCLVSENLESIENTNTKFAPRDGYPIELSKAGELPENPYLFDPNKPVKRPLQRRTAYSGVKYIYSCPICGKKFTRSTQHSNLGKHKNKNGYPCFGSYGIYVGTKYN